MMQLKWVFELLLLSAIWGSSFMFMRIASPEIGAMPLTFIRCVIATVILGAIVYFTRKTELRLILRHWFLLTALAITNTALPFSLWAYVSLFLESGTMGIINATAPMFGVLIAFFWLGEKLTSGALLGLVLGFLGVAMLLIDPASGLSLDIVPVLIGLFACVNYGLAACISKAYAEGLRPMTIAAGSQLYSSLVLLPFALMSWPEQAASAEAWSSTLFLGVACSGFAFYLYYKLIAEQGIAKALTNMYLLPLFAILWGALFLNEQLQLKTFVGGAVVLLGIALTTGLVRVEKRRTAKA
ncbi:DMT family transporter [Paraneptunicella aestuarii]|uniref:DMT family transporter n=1 Tax=Paraneptunicella aestuarii TaxID=2831148 RepID=UPI001E5D9CDC|nr:DMT family transporter [Paraneptunicella aestuarii]UAA39190.1 DMT family transporter [Paraneptunicella aestuarii]